MDNAEKIKRMKIKSSFEISLEEFEKRGYSIENVIKAELITIEEIVFPERFEVVTSMAKFNKSVFINLAELYKEHLAEVTAKVMTEKHNYTSNSRDRLYFRTVDQESINSLYEIRSLIKPVFTFYTPHTMYMVTKKEKTKEVIDCSKNFIHTDSRIYTLTNIDPKNLMLFIKDNDLLRLKNASIVGEKDGKHLVMFSNHIKEISKSYLFDNSFKNLLDLIAYENAKYLLEPVFYKHARQKIGDFKKMPKSFYALLHASLFSRYAEKYTDMKKLMDNTPEIYNQTIQILKSNTPQGFIDEAIRLT